MNIDDTSINPADLESLLTRVYEAAGIKELSPKQFDLLADEISVKTGERLSPSTLKRISGYVAAHSVPRLSTLDILARFCGWSDYRHFLEGNSPEAQSGVVGKPKISVAEDMLPGQRLRLMWSPARVCVIEYKGDLNWEVVYSEGTRLQPGNTFKCALIMGGEPLYIDDLVQDGNPPRVYVCGRRSGITFVRDE